MVGVRPCQALAGTVHGGKSRPSSTLDSARTRSAAATMAPARNSTRCVALPLPHERRGHDPTGDRRAADVDDDRRLVGHVGRQEGQGDAVAEHRREVAAGDRARPAARRSAPRSPRGADGDPRWRCPAGAGPRPGSRSASSAALPRNAGLFHPTTQPSPACSGVMPGPSSWPCSGRPASSRSVSRAPSPAGSTPAPSTARHNAGGRLGRHGHLDAVLAGVAGAGDQARRCPSQREPGDAEAADGGRLGRHRRPARSRASGPCTAMTARPAVTSVAAHGVEHPGRCSRRWASRRTTRRRPTTR